MLLTVIDRVVYYNTAISLTTGIVLENDIKIY